jgi:hypothetical protein
LLEQLANVGELVGGLGALAALIYLAAQVRQSNRIARAASRQKLLDTFYDRAWEMGTNPELARVLAAGIMRWDSLSNRDKTTFHNMMSRWLSNVENGIALRDEGLVGDESVRFIGIAMANCIKAPGGQSWWSATKRDEIVAPIVVAYLESLLRDSSVQIAGFDQTFPFWAALADEGPSEGGNSPAA